MGIIEFFATMADGKTHCKRVLFEGSKSVDAARQHWLGEIENQSEIKIGRQP
jgi:hypothetical protein